MAAAAAFTGVSCNRTPARLERTAILPFENLTGDRAVDQWAAVMQHSLQAMTDGRSAASNEAAGLLGGASAIGRGVIERIPSSGKLSFHYNIYDAASHRLLQSASAEESDPFAAALTIAKAIDKNAKPLGNRKPETLALWTTTLNSVKVDDLVANCRKLIESEPAFSPAYTSCGLALISTPIPLADRKQLGTLGYANRESLTPESQNIVGQLLFQSGQFQQASEVMTKVAATIPSAWNQVGYSQVMLGNLPAAKKALEDYRKFGGDEPNAVDSLGEVHYFAGKYEEAEKYFTEAGERFGQTRQGQLAPLKAAAMRAMRGDRGKAEELAQTFIGGLKKQGQDTRPLEELWRNIILEQDPQAMKKRIEASIILSPTREQ